MPLASRLTGICVLGATVFVGGCAAPAGRADTEVQPAAATTALRPPVSTSADSVAVRDAGGAAVVQKVPFRVGESSVTVEHLARRFGCVGSPGAGLVTKPGPLEVYRMQCENGTTFMAECELRQCRPMR